MEILDNNECKQWVKNNTKSDLSRISLEKEFNHSISYLIPVDAGKKNSLAQLITNNFNFAKEGCFWVTGYGIWPSCENYDLFDGYRKSLGENRSVSEAPAHIFLWDDSKQLCSLVLISLYFFWDAILIEGGFEVVFVISHDEIIKIYAKDKKRLSKLKINFEKSGFKKECYERKNYTKK